jgi:hypothetical protein
MYALKAANETAPLGLLSEFLLVAVSLALVPVSLAAGLGLLMRRRYGVILFFILCGLRFLLKLRETWSSGAAQSEMAIALCGGFLLFLIPNLIYFKKRWWGLEKKQ